MRQLSSAFSLCIKSIFLLSSILYCYSSYAYDFEAGGIYYNIQSIENLTCVVTSPKITPPSPGYRPRPNPDLYSGNIVIPQNPVFRGRTLTVVGIEYCAFYKCRRLLSVSIPPTVKTIDEEAFCGCENLAIVSGTINASIGINAFAGCRSLKAIELGKCATISQQAFDGCTSLDQIIIPATVKTIGIEAFANCGWLSKVEIKNASSKLTIHCSVFKGSPINDLYVGRNLTFWTNSSFLPPFEDIVHLSFGDQVTSIYDDVKGIGEAYATEREIREKHKSVFDREGLKTIVFGKSLTKVPSFEKANLEKITCRSSIPPVVDGTISFFSIINAILVVPSGATASYKSVSPWKDFSIQEL